MSKLKAMWNTLRYSLRWRLLLLFMLLAFAMSAVFVFGAQRFLDTAWNVAAKPIVNDYIDRMTAEIGLPPSTDAALALTKRLPITIDIQGPSVNWQSHPRLHKRLDDYESRWEHRRRHSDDWDDAFWLRDLPDGHKLAYGLNFNLLKDDHSAFFSPLLWVALLTALAYFLVSRLLAPLFPINAGISRFAKGDFAEPIKVKTGNKDELNQLGVHINNMAGSIKSMLDAKRELLFAISHELRSPLTRGKLHAELLDNSQAQSKDALLKELDEINRLLEDILESERVGEGHSALRLENVEIRGLMREFAEHYQELTLDLPETEVWHTVDKQRITLLLRNLVSNAMRYGKAPIELRLRVGEHLLIEVRDYGEGVPADELNKLTEAFYRPDTARSREYGGVGLGLYLCNAIVKAHQGNLRLENANPGLSVQVKLPVRSH